MGTMISDRMCPECDKHEEMHTDEIQEHKQAKSFATQTHLCRIQGHLIECIQVLVPLLLLLFRCIVNKYVLK